MRVWSAIMLISAIAVVLIVMFGPPAEDIFQPNKELRSKK